MCLSVSLAQASAWEHVYRRKLVIQRQKREMFDHRCDFKHQNVLYKAEYYKDESIQLVHNRLMQTRSLRDKPTKNCNFVFPRRGARTVFRKSYVRLIYSPCVSVR